MDRNYAQRNMADISREQMEGMRNTLAPPVAQPPLANAIDNLRRKVNSLESLYDTMAQKLAPILVPIPEAPMKDSGAGIAGPQSAVVMELSELEYRLGMLCRKVDTLITRIEA